MGLLPSLYLIEKYGRKPTLIWPFLVCSISLFVLGATSGLNMSFVFILVLFIIYGTFNTAMGFITGVTRIASSIGTFFFPFILGNYCLAAAMYICGALLFIAFLVTMFMAPETKNMSLTQDSFVLIKTAN
ncbi:hypothetical protein [Ammoniphilus sp. 3BR4]|uniref:hypothetical protein n=1 Tax=Ammoniphilus sp. 3BR4 TaxID=3158265 RepID=UPI0034670F74